MGIFSKLMGEDGSLAEHAPRSIRPLAAEHGAITYDADLVERLKAEHQDLLLAFTTIRKTGAEGRFGHLPEMLEQFKLALLNHIALENVKFYVYMQHHAAVDTQTQGFIANVRKEMNVIARTVAKFVDTHLAETPTHATLERFNRELDQIGDVLAGRIALEENQLYALYRP